MSLKEKIRCLLRKVRILATAHDFYIRLKASRRSRMISRHGLDVLAEIHRILATGDIVFFADFGTLLGLIREQRLLGHDQDLDIGVLKHDEMTISRVRELLVNHGMRLRHEYLYQGRVMEQSYIHKHIKFDISYYEQDGEFSKCYLFYRAPGEVYPEDSMNVVCMTYNRIEGTILHAIGRYRFNIPTNTYEVLEQKYGTDWRTPDTTWVYWKGPSASVCDGLGIHRRH